jgi:hypothetical protein
MSMAQIKLTFPRTQNGRDKALAYARQIVS